MRLGRLAAVLASLLLGCGAKTGLNVPDADAGVDAGPDAPCITLPLDGGPIEVPLETEAIIGRADILFLIDTTASMQDEIDQVRARLRDRLAPAIDDAIPDAELAVATFADFPVEPYGNRDEDRPFVLRLPVTGDLSAVQAALSRIDLGDGRDEPESQVEALYQVATGEGLGGFVPAAAGCPGGGVGYPCFRRDALPLILMFTDAPFHNGPGSAHEYTSVISPPPHDYAEAVEELNRIGIQVLGFDSGGTDGHLEQLARDTGAVDTTGAPLVFDIGPTASQLTTSVVEAIRTFAGSVVFDIDAVLSDPDPGDGVDVLGFIEAIEPLRADPMSGVREIDRDAGVFRGVTSGTTVFFLLRIRNDAVVPGDVPRAFRLEITFRGDGRTLLERKILTIVIPASDGSGCEALP